MPLSFDASSEAFGAEELTLAAGERVGPEEQGGTPSFRSFWLETAFHAFTRTIRGLAFVFHHFSSFLHSRCIVRWQMN